MYGVDVLCVGLVFVGFVEDDKDWVDVLIMGV